LLLQGYMNNFFSGYNRYQIIFPYESSKQHSEPDLDHGAYKCYQELVENNVMTHIFIVHNIDTGDIYYFDIPKNKHLETSQPMYLEKDPSTVDYLPYGLAPKELYPEKPFQPIQSTMCNNQNHNQDQQFDQFKQTTIKPYIQSSIQPSGQPSIQQPSQQPSQQPIQQPIQQPVQQSNQQSMQQEYDRMRQNDLVTRLNRVEYQLDLIQMEMRKPQKKEEDNCVLL